MLEEVLIAGFGGQGILLAGEILAQAAMDEGREVAWVPTYGPEQRGGTANCTVIVSDEEIGSLIGNPPTAAMIMNAPSLDKFEPTVKTGGVLVVNRSLAPRRVARQDLRVVSIPASEMAVELGNERLANMVALGAFLGATRLVPLDHVIVTLPKALPRASAELLELNRRALREGANYVEVNACV